MPDVVWKPKSVITDVPEDGAVVGIVRDRWWPIWNEQVAFHADNGDPVMHPNRDLALRIAARFGPDVSIRRIPVAYLRLQDMGL